MLYRIDIDELLEEYIDIDVDCDLDKFITEWLKWASQKEDLNTIRDDELADMIRMVFEWEQDGCYSRSRMNSVKPINIITEYAWWYCILKPNFYSKYTD